MASRVVRPETTKIDISDGDWLIVKKRLNHGEQQESFARKYIADAFGGNRVNLKLAGMDRVTAYLVDWSLIDLEDRAIPIRGKPIDEVEAALNAIDPESFAEIRDAIAVHEVTMKAERDAKKNGPDGATASSPTSPSPALAAGLSPTSAT